MRPEPELHQLLQRAYQLSAAPGRSVVVLARDEAELGYLEARLREAPPAISTRLETPEERTLRHARAL